MRGPYRKIACKYKYILVIFIYTRPPETVITLFYFDKTKEPTTNILTYESNPFVQ